MKTTLNDVFEQSIEYNAEQFVPLSDTEKTEVETIINAANEVFVNERAVLKSLELLRQT